MMKAANIRDTANEIYGMIDAIEFIGHILYDQGVVESLERNTGDDGAAYLLDTTRHAMLDRCRTLLGVLCEVKDPEEENEGNA